MMALRHQLRADDDIDASLRDLSQLAAHGLDRCDQIARQHHGARLWKQAGCFLLQALDAGADRHQRLLRRTLRTDMRARHREAAVVANKTLAKAMIDQPGVADRAGKAMPAGPA